MIKRINIESILSLLTLLCYRDTIIKTVKIKNSDLNEEEKYEKGK